MATEPRRIAVWLGGGSALAAALLAWLWFGVEWVEEEIDLGYGGAARRVHYLAAERFLERHDIPVEIVSGFSLLDDLPSSDDLVLLPTPRHTLSQRRLAELRRWLAAGGRAVVVAEDWSDPETLESRDELLAGYGLHRLADDVLERRAAGDPHGENVLEPAESPEEEAAESLSTEEEEILEAIEEIESFGDLLLAQRPGELPECWDLETTLPAFDGPNEFDLQLSEHGRLYYEDESGELLPSPHGEEVLHARIGSGRLTVLTAAHVFTNQRIHCHDHAFFLWTLAQGAERLWLVNDPDVRALPVLAAKALPLGTLGAGLWLLAWLSHLSLRFGRAVAETDSVRRRWLEHLEASGEFRWRHRQLEATLRALCDDLEHQAARRLPGFAGADAPARALALASRARLPLADVVEAMSAGVPEKRRELVRRVARLQKIRRRL